ncbi:MAG: hypothetical protein V2I33_17045 [Kangiellaceae bacterium]|nr:hypothetical protein [Kangiellaceae bacterium]
MFENRPNAARRLEAIIGTTNSTLHEKEAAHGMGACINEKHKRAYNGQTKVVGSNLPINTKIQNLAKSVFS